VQFGKVVKVTIPRPAAPGQPTPPGVGKVIIEFTEVEAAVKAQRSLHGRKFGGRAVIASYVTEQDYEAGRL
jgi:splicing factor U2AF 65 kDa subunit